MRELVVILPDYFTIASDRRVAASAGSSAALSRLPLLERVLARASHSPLPAGDWRRWLCEWFGPSVTAATSPFAPAITVANAWGEPIDPARQFWLATPVHLFAGLDSVRLHPQGLLRLSVPEQARLVSDFATVFHDSPWRLIARQSRDLLLVGPSLRASGKDPATLLGQDPSEGLPRGADAAALRRLSSEIELWLHEHPVNLERQHRSELPVTALWLWGGPAAPDDMSSATPTRKRRPSAPLPRLLGEDTYVEALWQERGGSTDSPASAPDEAIGAAGGCVLLQPASETPGIVPVLELLEQRWLPSAWRALRAHRLSSLCIVTAQRVHRLDGWDLMRVWRRARPWWEAL